MIAYIPLYVNLTSTQGCIRGLAHACVCVCVCVEASKEEGDVRGRMCTRWRVWWRWERGRKNFEPLFLKLTSPPGCMMGKREVGTKGACGKIDSFRVGLLLLPFLINSRSFVSLYMDSFSDMHNLSSVSLLFLKCLWEGLFFLRIYLAYHIFKPFPIEVKFQTNENRFFRALKCS